MNLQEARKRIPELEGLSDESALGVIQQVYYPDMDRATLAGALGYKMPEPPAPDRTWGAVAKDVGVSALKGAIAVPEAFVGMADLLSGGVAGKALEDAGFRPGDAKAILNEQYSDKQKQAFQAVSQADGFMGKMGAALANPSVIGHTLVESAPLMGMGGVIGRGVTALAPKVSGVLAGAIGEGAVGAGSSAEGIRQATPDGTLSMNQSALAGASGALTGAFTLLGGKVAQKLGIADVDTMLASAAANPAVRKGVVRSALEGAVSEGVLEELPQSVQEQVLQNAALGKPLDEGVDQAAVMGLLSGMAMGGGANAVSGFAKPPAQQAADAIRAAETVPESGPMTRSVNAGTEAKAQAVEAGAPLVDEQAAAEPMPEPVDDPVRDQILALPDGARQDALRAYAVVNRDDVAKGVQQYNRKLLDRLLKENEPAPEAAPEIGGVVHNFDPASPPVSTLSLAPIGEVNYDNGIDFQPGIQAELASRSAELDKLTQRAPRKSTAPADLSLPTDPVQNYLDGLRSVNTPAARAYVRDFDIGRITPADVQRRMQAEQGMTPDQRIARAAAEAPAQVDSVADRLSKAAAQGQGAIAPTDILNPSGLPFKTQMAAKLAAKKTPGAVIPVDGGFVVRPQEPVNVQDVPQASEVPETAPAVIQPSEAPQAVGAQPAGPTAGVPAEGAGAVEAAGVNRSKLLESLDQVGSTREQVLGVRLADAQYRLEQATASSYINRADQKARINEITQEIAGLNDVRADAIELDARDRNEGSTRSMLRGARQELDAAVRAGSITPEDAKTIASSAKNAGNAADASEAIFNAVDSSVTGAAPEVSGVAEIPPLDPLGWNAKKLASTYDMAQMAGHQCAIRR
ncbi:hypothetical protein C380_10890 [Acidovorax sp. KKS102]|uniref:hypothetical protein n=1 Tax=Acidovorax sp. KKS102 TaxID=358220 RepID=UPI00028AFADF|nr:hypothetical protein [Acidovorax sp. KKS102]AFU45879.1 hypothetical protein C380_10890 [Acidovorax sp. KKS102]